MDKEQYDREQKEYQQAVDLVTGLYGGVIKGFNKHGLSRALGRDTGLGVINEAILNAVNNPSKIVKQDDGKIKYIGENATVILNKYGEVITTWARNKAGWR